MLVIDNVTVSAGERVLFTGFSLRVERGETLFVVGPSGTGKSLLLRSLATLDPLRSGRLALDGKTPHELGFPAWRARVCYVSQSRWAFPGTPAETFTQAKHVEQMDVLLLFRQGYAAQRGRSHGDLAQHASAVGLEAEILDQAWSTLSGGQAQRCQLAIATALGPDVLLLDEPTSALDAASVSLVEAHLKGSGCAIVWVSHDPTQPARVGGRVVQFPLPGGPDEPSEV